MTQFKAGSAVTLAGLAVLGLVLAGCGSSSPSKTTAAPLSTAPLSPAAVATPTHNVQVTAADTGALVAGKPIAKTSLQHWASIEKALGQTLKARHQALGFLITSEWVLREAAAMHITVSEAEVKARYSALIRKSFRKPGALQKFFAASGETEADLLARIRVEMLAEKIAAKVTAGKKGAQRAAALRAFEKRFHEHWKRLTSCKKGYVMEDCKQYKGPGENLAASPSQSAANKKAEEAITRGEVYSPPNGFTISSLEFERNEPIPSEYTCSGAGISPALTWEKVPAGAAALVLFVIDDNSSGKEGGQRWIVANIDPSSKGVAAGQTPAGGVVGTNAAGKAEYSPICPEKGHSDTIEFVMYALSKKLNVSPGFNPTSAEAEYGEHKLFVGQAAITYGIASR